MRTEVVGRWEGFEALAPEWNRLVERSRQNIPFLRYEWLAVWWRHFSKPDDVLRVTLLYDEAGQLLAGAPMMLRQERVYGMPCRVLQLLVNDHSSRGGFVVAADTEPGPAVAELWAGVVATAWDMVHLRDLADEPEDGVLTALQTVLRHEDRRHIVESALQSPTLPIQGTWADYEGRLSSRFRRNLRSRRRKLERELGPAHYELIKGATPNLERRLAVGFDLEASGWKGRAGSAIVQDPAVHGFYQDLAAEAARLGWLRLSFLSAGGAPLAFGYGLEYGGRHYLLKSGYDEQYRRFSPGQVLRQESIADAHQRGLQAYELLGTVSHWKRDWTSEVRQHRTVWVYGNTPRAWPPYALTRLRHSRAAAALKARLRQRQAA